MKHSLSRIGRHTAAFLLAVLGEVLLIAAKPLGFLCDCLRRLGNRFLVEAWLLKHEPRIYDR